MPSGTFEAIKTALDGNYGADYNFTVTLKNPGPLPRPVGIYFGPEAGTAAGCFTFAYERRRSRRSVRR